MKNIKTKGFTLIECIISLAIFAIAALTMAQIFTMVGKMNVKTHNNNTSLAYQMKHVQAMIGANAEAIPIKYRGTDDADTNTVPPHQRASEGSQFVTIYRNDVANDKYSYAVDMYVLLSRDGNDLSSTDPNYNGATEKGENLRYKYFLPHTTGGTP